MSISIEDKADIIKKFATKEGDTGSPEVQVAILTTRINNLTGHFKDHKKDRSPKKVKDARKAFKKEEAVKLTRGGGPPIPKPPADGEPPSEEEARRRARRLMRRMSRKRKGKKHRKSKAFKKGML